METLLTIVRIACVVLIVGIGLLFVYYELTGQLRPGAKPTRFLASPTRRRVWGYVWCAAFAVHVAVVLARRFGTDL